MGSVEIHWIYQARPVEHPWCVQVIEHRTDYETYYDANVFCELLKDYRYHVSLYDLENVSEMYDKILSTFDAHGIELDKLDILQLRRRIEMIGE